MTRQSMTASICNYLKYTNAVKCISILYFTTTIYHYNIIWRCTPIQSCDMKYVYASKAFQLNQSLYCNIPSSQILFMYWKIWNVIHTIQAYPHYKIIIHTLWVLFSPISNINNESIGNFNHSDSRCTMYIWYSSYENTKQMSNYLSFTLSLKVG